MGFEPGNIVNLGFILKGVELVFVFIIFMLHRLANGGYPIAWSIDSIDAGFLGTIVSAGYFYFIIIIMVGMVFGDKAKIQNLLFNVFGFIFFLAAGSKVIADYNGAIADVLGSLADKELAMGSMAIITSLIFLVDALFSGLGLKNGD